MHVYSQYREDGKVQREEARFLARSCYPNGWEQFENIIFRR